MSTHALRFRRLAEQRLAARFRVIAVDLRGHGFSDWEPPWDLDTHLDDLVETVEALDVGATVWIGHSFGGRLVLELAAREPARVERAVLLDPAVWVPPQVALERADAMREDELFDSPEDAVETRFSAGGIPFTPRAFLEEELPEHLTRGDDGRYRYRYSRSAVVAAYGEMSKPPPLEQLRVPTLLIRGALSEVVPEQAIDFCRTTYGSQLEVATVPGNHVVLWDAFTETADAIEAFLA